MKCHFGKHIPSCVGNNYIHYCMLIVFTSKPFCYWSKWHSTYKWLEHFNYCILNNHFVMFLLLNFQIFLLNTVAIWFATFFMLTQFVMHRCKCSYQFPGIVTYHLPDKITLEMAATNHSFQVTGFIDEPIFYWVRKISSVICCNDLACLPIFHVFKKWPCLRVKSALWFWLCMWPILGQDS